MLGGLMEDGRRLPRRDRRVGVGRRSHGRPLGRVGVEPFSLTSGPARSLAWPGCSAGTDPGRATPLPPTRRSRATSRRRTALRPHAPRTSPAPAFCLKTAAARPMNVRAGQHHSRRACAASALGITSAPPSDHRLAARLGLVAADLDSPHDTSAGATSRRSSWPAGWRPGRPLISTSPRRIDIAKAEIERLVDDGPSRAGGRVHRRAGRSTVAAAASWSCGDRRRQRTGRRAGRPEAHPDLLRG